MSEEPSTGVPDFAVVVRGYDREQVDAYVTQLVSLISDLRAEVGRLQREADVSRQAPVTQRGQEPEGTEMEKADEPTQASWAGLGSQVAALLDQAQAAADERRRKAEDEAESILEAARRQEGEAAAELELARKRWAEILGHLDQLRGEIDQLLRDAGGTPGN